MNYIWELILKAKDKNIDPKTIKFKIGQPFSGYMELSFEDINEVDILPVVEINPYYRYYSIFKNLFDPNLVENQEIIDCIHDLVIHHLADIDVFMGMNRREYYINFVIKDMYEGFFGEYIKDKIDIFTKNEQKILANNILNLYKTGESIFVLRDTIKKIFVNSYIFYNIVEKDEIILFLRTKKTKEKEEKIEVIKYLFLNFKYNVEIYWENIFGVIGVEDMMIIDNLLNY
ncbi:hypothetical protein [Defluviitalea phaphyphila]|uniref:hypothetical protein n=1 Tax=Defluviitalea phaphyphila TaxID=1473580 RepID=UPI0007318A8D|nr:hypothetical protein [Defluviitalea phaphyphila]